MSLSRRGLLISMPLALVLAGCGFHPLHGKTGANKSTTAELAKVKIKLIADRSGQMVRNELLDLLTPLGEPEKPRYYLIVTLSESKSSLGILKDETASRSNYILTSSFSLSTIEGKALYSSSVISQASYNILQEHYASTASEKNARERTAREIAEGIQLQLSSYFSRMQSVEQVK